VLGNIAQHGRSPGSLWTSRHMRPMVAANVI
jgi:hypothetical protein